VRRPRERSAIISPAVIVAARLKKMLTRDHW